MKFFNIKLFIIIKTQITLILEVYDLSLIPAGNSDYLAFQLCKVKRTADTPNTLVLKSFSNFESFDATEYLTSDPANLE